MIILLIINQKLQKKKQNDKVMISNTAANNNSQNHTSNYKLMDTPQKSLYRPRSSTYYKSNNKSNYQINIENAQFTKTNIKPAQTFRRLFNSQKKRVKDDEIASKKASFKLQLQRTEKKLRKGQKQVVFLEDKSQKKNFSQYLPQKNNSTFFSNRKDNQYKSKQPCVIEEQPIPKEKIKTETYHENKSKSNREESIAINNNHQKIKEKQKIIDKLTQMANTIRNSNIKRSNSSKRGSIRLSKSQALGDMKQNNQIYQQGDNQGLQQDIPINEKLNYILDSVGDVNLNNILWNDPTVQKILDKLKIQNEQELNDYLENNTQYFSNLFRSSPFGSFNLHYVRPPISSYNLSYKNQQDKLFNDMPHIKLDDYESLAQLHLKKSRFKKLSTNHQSQFYPKKSSTKQVIPPSTIKLGSHPQIVNKTTYSMQLPNRLDYDPTRIFKRLPENNVVLGAQLRHKTQYQKIYNQKPDQREQQIPIQYIKQRNQPQKSLWTKNNSPQFYETAYSSSFVAGRKVKYTPPPFKYHTELQKAIKEDLPPEAYETTKAQDSKFVVQNLKEQHKTRRKSINPWQFRILSKLKALMQYKKFLQDRKK